jgi:hypothetical protein
LSRESVRSSPQHEQTTMKNTIDAKCCAAAERPGTAHFSNLRGHHPQKLQCVTCGKEYSVDYNPADQNRVADFDRRLIATAQKATNDDHRVMCPTATSLIYMKSRQ